ncbi:MAG: hypothetical protein N3C59_09655 [Azovibrio sp.]|nr:hypothetical protein [Azovibrio sp.]
MFSPPMIGKNARIAWQTAQERSCDYGQAKGNNEIVETRSPEQRSHAMPPVTRPGFG